MTFGALKTTLQDSLWDAAFQVVSIWVVNGREATENIFDKIFRKHKFYFYLCKFKHRSSFIKEQRHEDFERSLEIVFDANGPGIIGE
jgi:hypothetical protein